MTRDSVNAAAERLSSRRTRMLPVLAVLFIVQQSTFVLGMGAGTGDRMVDHVQITAWLALSVIMLLLLTTGGGWLYSRQVRALANDETTRAHREAALSLGFIASMVACVALYLIDVGEPVSGREAVHLVMSVGIGAALLRFAFLERRAARDG